MDEQDLINRFFARPEAGPPIEIGDHAGMHVMRDQSRGVVLGIGDDGAVVRPPPGYDLVVATDAIFEGTHFPDGIPPAAVGHRALAVNLSDLAAMGAEPLWCSLALSLPRVDADWLGEFSRGFLALADRCQVSLIGGDTVRGPLGACVTVHGCVRPGTAILRSGARAGDGIWVTGHPGEAVAGRRLLAPGAQPPDDATLQLQQRFLYPEPRLAEGRALAGLASAMLDVSDGLADDLGKLMAASGTGAEMEVERLPLSAAHLLRAPDSAVTDALTGGDDYELLFTLGPDREAELAARAAAWSVAATRIGRVIAGDGVRWRHLGRPLPVPATTFRHFR